MIEVASAECDVSAAERGEVHSLESHKAGAPCTAPPPVSDDLARVLRPRLPSAHASSEPASTVTTLKVLDTTLEVLDTAPKVLDTAPKVPDTARP